MELDNIEPHAFVLAQSTMRVCVFVKKRDGESTAGCKEGDPDSDTLPGFQGCCGSGSAAFGVYSHYLHDDTADGYLLIDSLETDACVSYSLTYGSGSM